MNLNGLNYSLNLAIEAIAGRQCMTKASLFLGGFFLARGWFLFVVEQVF